MHIAGGDATAGCFPAALPRLLSAATLENQERMGVTCSKVQLNGSVAAALNHGSEGRDMVVDSDVLLYNKTGLPDCGGSVWQTTMERSPHISARNAACTRNFLRSAKSWAPPPRGLHALNRAPSFSFVPYASRASALLR
ncbi:hypothetical protein ABL78_3509 [Leptomonas seymouri]|uniref:Uncharacterized protein n=1 Tax=Leptomonas seymouri TaxID=5684 RepID=A0A0N1PDK3_LEPSE|nr:hypothetical protein ABL78_3509 [Leptomonas seymouri]|eukprot:KPI87425.1 hypothetical protein ABL78_3509 [Leptomonas seymouri]